MRETIAGLRETIKREMGGKRGDDLFVLLLILIVGLGGFGLGRLSTSERNGEPVHIEYTEGMPAAPASAGAAAETASGLLVASRNGSKYHYPWCSGAKRIAEGNKLWFQSKEEAERAGYTPAANCKGL